MEHEGLSPYIMDLYDVHWNQVQRMSEVWAPVLPVTSLKISFLKEKEVQNNNFIFLPSQEESRLRFNLAKPS